MTDHKREGSQHRSALEKIAKNPSLVGIHGNIVGISVEKNYLIIREELDTQLQSQMLYLKCQMEE